MKRRRAAINVNYTILRFLAVRWLGPSRRNILALPVSNSIMKTYAHRLLAAVLGFSIGTAAFYLPQWHRLETPFRTTHSFEYERPYSFLFGRTIWIKPYDATFRIPQTWVTTAQVERNLYLSREDLNQMHWNDGGDAEDAQVVNAALPFEDCAAHFGDKAWGNYFWNDLQGRVYIVDLTPEEVSTSITTRGLNEASSVFEWASFTAGSRGPWQRVTLQVLDAPTHFALMKGQDFYYRRFGNKTVVFVFLNAGGFQPTVDEILNSFEWTDGEPSTECTDDFN